jgi:hypothetical protein
MRSDAHRSAVAADGAQVTEVASSPDTPGRPERWRWHVRLRDGSAPDRAPSPSRRSAELSAGALTSVEVEVDPALVAAAIEVVDVADTYLVEREAQGLVIIVQGGGRSLVEGRFELGEHDTFVLEGDDPTTVSLVPVGGGPTQVALVRLRTTSQASLGWVP